MDLAHELATLPQLTVAQLRKRYAALFGEPTNARHKVWLCKRIAWRLQASAAVDLSQRARQRAALLADDANLRLNPPKPGMTNPASVTAAATPPGTGREPTRTPGFRPTRPPAAASGQRPYPPLQRPGAACDRAALRLRLPGPGLSLPQRLGQGHLRLALQRLSLLPPAHQGDTP